MSSELTADILFPNKVWRAELNYDNSDLISCIQQMSSCSESAIHSNYGGWQSPSIDIDTLPHSFIKLKLEIDDQIKKVCDDTSLPSLSLDNLWFNVNPPGTYNIIHTHPHSVISGVYYIDAPEENMGNIRFYRDDAAEYYMPDNCTANNSFTALSVEYPPKAGILLLFPSWLKHSVQGNMSNKNRVSMSFNYGVKNEN